MFSTSRHKMDSLSVLIVKHPKTEKHDIKTNVFSREDKLHNGYKPATLSESQTAIKSAFTTPDSDLGWNSVGGVMDFVLLEAISSE